MRKLYIEPTSRCNLNCAICFRHSWRDEADGDMAPDTFEAIVRTMPGSVETVFFGGQGEPLAHPNLVEMVRRVSASGRRVEMLTNATLLTPDTSRRLLEAGLTMLWVSIDSFEASGAADLNHELRAIQPNLVAFNQERAKPGRAVRLGLNFVVMKSNAEQLAMIPRFSRRFSVNEVNVSNMLASGPGSETELLYGQLLNEGLGAPAPVELTTINVPLMNWRQEEVIRGLRGLFSSTEVGVNLSGQPLTRRTNYCRFVEEDQAFVRHDGQVSPCMALLHNGAAYWNGRERTIHHHSFGQVGPHGLDEIWGSEEYRLFREQVRKFDFSPCMQCSGCELSEENLTDCFGSRKPTCGACLWSEGLISCP